MDYTVRLNDLAKTKGFGLLTGSPGRGKTTAVRAWRQGLNNSQYKVVYRGCKKSCVYR